MKLLKAGKEPLLLGPAHITHEEYIQRVREVVITRVCTEEAKKLKHTRMVYGRGDHFTRGVTCFGQWTVHKPTTTHVVDLVEICLTGEENFMQLAGTTIHELAHVLAGPGSGHGKEWKEECAKLGLPGAKAIATIYEPAVFDKEVFEAIKQIPEPTDGKPNASFFAITRTGKTGCRQGVGVKGGKSRGAGSGSRLKKVSCGECGYIVRITKQWIEKGLPTCPCGTVMEEENG